MRHKWNVMCIVNVNSGMPFIAFCYQFRHFSFTLALENIELFTIEWNGSYQLRKNECIKEMNVIFHAAFFDSYSLLSYRSIRLYSGSQMKKKLYLVKLFMSVRFDSVECFNVMPCLLTTRYEICDSVRWYWAIV